MPNSFAVLFSTTKVDVDIFLPFSVAISCKFQLRDQLGHSQQRALEKKVFYSSFILFLVCLSC